MIALQDQKAGVRVVLKETLDSEQYRFEMGGHGRIIRIPCFELKAGMKGTIVEYGELTGVVFDANLNQTYFMVTTDDGLLVDIFDVCDVVEADEFEIEP